jgi:hypothetical protein
MAESFYRLRKFSDCFGCGFAALDRGGEVSFHLPTASLRWAGSGV